MRYFTERMNRASTWIGVNVEQLLKNKKKNLSTVAWSKRRNYII